MTRKVADCSRSPSETDCSLTLTGEEDEVIRAASEHAFSVHKHQDSAAFREQIREILEDEKASA
ncbi:DUF1059 domain-containing protein [Streptomyces aureoversilis]|uniref:DUF1059 domain-containing protein n=1 Tax=Streptomyces aureoversilis TaxID=67277 RepID=A0ABV9ZYS3_9ACTN